MLDGVNVFYNAIPTIVVNLQDRKNGNGGTFFSSDFP